jgi:hypothetical protein
MDNGTSMPLHRPHDMLAAALSMYLCGLYQHHKGKCISNLGDSFAQIQ